MNIRIIHYNLKNIQKEILSIPHFGRIYEWSFTSRKCHLLLSFLLASAFFDLLGQRVINFEKQGEGAIFLAEDISITRVNSGYTLWLPDSAQIKGLVVFMNARRDTLKSEFVIDYALENDLGGSPEESLDAYINYSPYSYIADDGGNAKYYSNIAIRTYTEPDVNWWIANRGKDYYGMNSVDKAGLINQLRILGNDNAELITTTDKGYRPNGGRHPHSWSIVDEKELVDWFLGLMERE